MKMRYILRDEHVDGAGAGGTSSTPAQTPTSAPSEAPKSVENIWGGSSAPDWVKNNALGKVHEKTNKGAAIVADEPAPNTVSPAAAPVQKPALQQPAAPAQAPAQVQQQAQVPVQPAASAVDPTQLAEAIVRAQQAAAQRTGQPNAQPTEADIRKQLNIYEVSDSDYESILGVKPDSPARVTALNGVLQKISQQSVTIAHAIMQREMARQQSELAPYVTAMRSTEADRQRNLFSTENPDLKGYEVLAEKEFNAMVSSGTKFATVEQARRAVASKVRETLRALNITPQVSASSSPATGAPVQSQAQQPRRMTTLSGGGRGAGSGGSAAAPTSVEAVWGKK